MSEVGCIIGRLDETMKQIAKQSDPKTKKQMVRERGAAAEKRACQKVGRNGDIPFGDGFEHGRNGCDCQYRAAFDETAGAAQQARQVPSRKFSKGPFPKTQGPGRIIAANHESLCRRCAGNLTTGENLELKVIILSKTSAGEAFLYWRPMGEGQYKKLSLEHIVRGVYTAAIPAADINGTDFEYYIKAELGLGKTLYFPAVAPDRTQTVVVN